MILLTVESVLKLDHIPAVGNATGGREGTKFSRVPTAPCNTVRYVSLTGMPAESNGFIQL